MMEHFGSYKEGNERDRRRRREGRRKGWRDAEGGWGISYTDTQKMGEKSYILRKSLQIKRPDGLVRLLLMEEKNIK